MRSRVPLVAALVAAFLLASVALAAAPTVIVGTVVDRHEQQTRLTPDALPQPVYIVTVRVGRLLTDVTINNRLDYLDYFPGDRVALVGEVKGKRAQWRSIFHLWPSPHDENPVRNA